VGAAGEDDSGVTCEAVSAGFIPSVEKLALPPLTVALRSVRSTI
jgi:hypothetical protein